MENDRHGTHYTLYCGMGTSPWGVTRPLQRYPSRCIDLHVITHYTQFTYVLHALNAFLFEQQRLNYEYQRHKGENVCEKLLFIFKKRLDGQTLRWIVYIFCKELFVYFCQASSRYIEVRTKYVPHMTKCQFYETSVSTIFNNDLT